MYGLFCGPCAAKLTKRQVLARTVVQFLFVAILIILFAIAISGFSSFTGTAARQVKYAADNASDIVYILASTSGYATFCIEIIIFITLGIRFTSYQYHPWRCRLTRDLLLGCDPFAPLCVESIPLAELSESRSISILLSHGPMRVIELSSPLIFISVCNEFRLPTALLPIKRSRKQSRSLAEVLFRIRSTNIEEMYPSISIPRWSPTLILRSIWSSIMLLVLSFKPTTELTRRLDTEKLR
jgi:hypothetical protein